MLRWHTYEGSAVWEQHRIGMHKLSSECPAQASHTPWGGVDSKTHKPGPPEKKTACRPQSQKTKQRGLQAREEGGAPRRE